MSVWANCCMGNATMLCQPIACNYFSKYADRIWLVVRMSVCECVDFWMPICECKKWMLAFTRVFECVPSRVYC